MRTGMRSPFLIPVRKTGAVEDRFSERAQVARCIRSRLSAAQPSKVALHLKRTETKPRLNLSPIPGLTAFQRKTEPEKVVHRVGIEPTTQ
jgi:hypothetical protein